MIYWMETGTVWTLIPLKVMEGVALHIFLATKEKPSLTHSWKRQACGVRMEDTRNWVESLFVSRGKAGRWWWWEEGGGEAVVLRSNDVSLCHSCSCRWRILRVSLTLDTRVNYDSSSSCAAGMWSRFVLITRRIGLTYHLSWMDQHVPCFNGDWIELFRIF